LSSNAFFYASSFFYFSKSFFSAREEESSLVGVLGSFGSSFLAKVGGGA